MKNDPAFPEAEHDCHGLTKLEYTSIRTMGAFVSKWGEVLERDEDRLYKLSIKYSEGLLKQLEAKK